MVDQEEYALKFMGFWKLHRKKVYLALSLILLGFIIKMYWEHESEQHHQAAFDHYVTFESSLKDDDKGSMTRTVKILKENDMLFVKNYKVDSFYVNKIFKDNQNIKFEKFYQIGKKQW